MKTQYNWKPVIASLVSHMRLAGFVASSVDNGDGWIETETDDSAISEIEATDESHVLFTCADEKRPLWAFIVLGNDPCELVADYSARETEQGRKFDAAISEWSDGWQGIPCPEIPVVR